MTNERLFNRFLELKEVRENWGIHKSGQPIQQKYIDKFIEICDILPEDTKIFINLDGSLIVKYDGKCWDILKNS